MITAGELLDRARIAVEPELKRCEEKFEHRMPACKSQSMRASKAVGLIEWLMEYNDALDGSMDISEKVGWYLTRDRIQTFLAIHATVCILEKLERDPNCNILE